jgi:hypothetical protein
VSIYAVIIDLDELFNTLPRQPIIANHFNIDSEADRDEINRLIMTQYGSDFLEIEPSCDCRLTKGGDKEGVICPHCGTEVVAVTERQLEPSLWLALPRGVKAFINPKVYTILSNELTISKFNILEHLVNPNAVGPENVTKHPTVMRYMKLNIPRGINHFYDNFDEIIQILVKENILQKDSNDKLGYMGVVNSLIHFLSQYRDRIFCQHLPLPTKLMMITEQTVTTTFASSNIFKALDAARTVAGAENNPGLPLKTLQAKAMKANALMAEYNEQCFHEFFDQKDGWFRQHVYGTRSHFTFRAVINSLTDPHDYWELHIPWSLAVMVFRVHLIAKLLKGSPATGGRRWSLRSAQSLLDENTLRYNPLMDALFKELIAEAPGGRIAVLFNRNPSLLRGSMQLLYITKVKPEVEVRSISLSVLTLRSLNADFDGDALNGLVILDNKMLRKLQRLEQHLTVLDTNRPRQLSQAMKMPEQIVATAASYIHRGR